MSNISTKTDDSFQTCCSSIFESSQESESDSLHDALNSRVFLVPSSINDMWLLEQINKFKLLNSKDNTVSGDEFKLESNSNSDSNNTLKSDCDEYNNQYFPENEHDYCTTEPLKLSDLVKNKLNLDEKRNNNQLFDGDSHIINELIRQLSLDSQESESNQQDITLTQCEIEEIKGLLSQDY
ncbi:hypothetical protein FG386_000930 [Cryptosporidium ryanae]|uniref:uncharacterized protein n=1 Tax=Cryptosporidium ryanae TaxID=515981 RepID=UPI00351AA2EA|nr:hypothetical protein FG386_000930 [Cryptosporidium ryanae]